MSDYSDHAMGIDVGIRRMEQFFKDALSTKYDKVMIIPAAGRINIMAHSVYHANFEVTRANNCDYYLSIDSRMLNSHNGEVDIALQFIHDVNVVLRAWTQMIRAENGCNDDC